MHIHSLTHSRERHDESINRTALNLVSNLARFQSSISRALEHAVACFPVVVMLTLFSVCVVSVLSLSLILCCACSFVFVHGQQRERSESHFGSSSSGSHTRSHAFQGSNPMHTNSCRSLEGHHASKSSIVHISSVLSTTTGGLHRRRRRVLRTLRRRWDFLLRYEKAPR